MNDLPLYCELTQGLNRTDYDGGIGKLSIQLGHSEIFVRDLTQAPPHQLKTTVKIIAINQSGYAKGMAFPPLRSLPGHVLLLQFLFFFHPALLPLSQPWNVFGSRSGRQSSSH